jgi:hypothetical protein
MQHSQKEVQTSIEQRHLFRANQNRDDVVGARVTGARTGHKYQCSGARPFLCAPSCIAASSLGITF